MNGVNLKGDLMITILLVDDQSIVRQGLRMELALEPDMTVVGEADSGEKALALAAHLQPNVVLMDVELPLMDGITTTAKLRAVAPTCAVVILSLYDDALARSRSSVVDQNHLLRLLTELFFRRLADAKAVHFC